MAFSTATHTHDIMHSSVGLYAIVRCLSVTLRYCIDTAERLELVFETEATILHYFVKEFGCLQEIRLLPCGTMSQSLNLDFSRFLSRHCGIDLFSCLAASVF